MWAYRNTPHESICEKPSFLLYDLDCRNPTEAALLPPSPLQQTNVRDYQRELVLSLSSAQKLAVSCIQEAQWRYKLHYDKTALPASYDIGDWVLVRFLQEKSGPRRKLCRPWHGPSVSIIATDITVVKEKIHMFTKLGEVVPARPTSRFLLVLNQKAWTRPPSEVG